MTEKTSAKAKESAAKNTPDTPIPAPDLPYKPRDPKSYHPAIGLIACGSITETHLTAYRNAGYNVVALCDLIEERAVKRQKQFFPHADTYVDYRELLARDDIEVVDIATHPHDRVPLIRDSLLAGKHVLSQKPFVLDLNVGQELIELADRQGRRLAVNQNGRWAPHFSYIRHAVSAGLVGDVMSIHHACHWDHSWTLGTPFAKIRDIILYDFAIHAFDFVSCVMGDRKRRCVYATRTSAVGQPDLPPLLGQAIVEFEGAQVSLIFDGFTRLGRLDETYVSGTKGTIQSGNPGQGPMHTILFTEKGFAQPELEGKWFPDGFHGTMGELLRAIEEDREPTNSARNNLRSLELCFAAIAAADDGTKKVPGEVRRLPAGAAPGVD